jgi:hypothetical protein
LGRGKQQDGGVSLTPVKSLNSVQWKGQATFRSLSYYFKLRYNWRPIGRYIERVFGRFAVAPDPVEEGRGLSTPSLPPQYSIVVDGFRGRTRYRLFFGSDEVIAAWEPPNVLESLFSHVNMETCLQTGDYLLVHSGAVVSPAGLGVLLPGASGSGKTSLVTGLVQAGFGFLSDEAAAIDPVRGKVYPYPRAIALKAGAFSQFESLRPKRLPSFAPRSMWRIGPDDIRPGALAGPSKIGFVIVPRYEQGKPTELSEISRAETVVELARNSMNMSTYEGRALHVLARALKDARCYRLVRGSLDEGVKAVIQATGGWAA